jgi:MFS family permease
MSDDGSEPRPPARHVPRAACRVPRAACRRQCSWPSPVAPPAVAWPEPGVPTPHEPAHPTTTQTVADDAFLTPAETWALVGSQPLAQLSNMALLPSLGAMRLDLNLSYSELGAVVASFGFARLLVDLPAGSLARRWNPRAILLAAFAVSALGSALGALAANAWQIAAVRLLIGVASSIAQAMILAWLVGGAGRVARGRVMARGEAFFSVAGLVIPALGGLLASQLSWRVAFVLGAIAAAIGFAAIFAFTRASGAARSVGLEPAPAAAQTVPPTPRAQGSPSYGATASASHAGEPTVRLSRHLPEEAAASLAHLPSPPGADLAPAAALDPTAPPSNDGSPPFSGPSLDRVAAPASSPTAKPDRADGLADTTSHSTEPEKNVTTGGWRDLRHGGHVLLAAYVATFVVFFARNGLLNAVLPVMGTDRLGIEPFHIGILFSTINAFSIASVLLGGRAGDRFGRYRMLAPGLAILLVSQLLLFLIHDPLTYVVIGLIQGLSFFINPLPPVILGDALPARARPHGIAIYRAVSDLALLCAPSIMGAALEAGGFAAAELASVAVIGVALLLIVGINVRYRHA